MISIINERINTVIISFVKLLTNLANTNCIQIELRTQLKSNFFSRFFSRTQLNMSSRFVSIDEKSSRDSLYKKITLKSNFKWFFSNYFRKFLKKNRLNYLYNRFLLFSLLNEFNSKNFVFNAIRLLLSSKIDSKIIRNSILVWFLMRSKLDSNAIRVR